MNDEHLKRVLIVDDDPDWLVYLCDLLYHPKHPLLIKTAKDGEQALDLIPEADLVITDVKMPKMGGFSLLKEIKKIRPELPVIMQTGGYADEGYQDISSHLGLAGFLQKNELDKLLWPMVIEILGKNRKKNRKKTEVRFLRTFD